MYEQITELKTLVLGVVCFLISYIFDIISTAPIYEILKYAALIVPILYTIWRWWQDIKKKRKE